MSALTGQEAKAIGEEAFRVAGRIGAIGSICHPLNDGLWEVCSSLASGREARLFFGFHEGMLIAL